MTQHEPLSNYKFKNNSMKYQKLVHLFEKFDVPYTLYKHEPIFTVEEGNEFKKTIPGAHSKNLFIKHKKNYFLISVLGHKRVDLKTFEQQHKTGKLSFCNEQELYSLLDVIPGSVTPYSLITEHETPITFFLDEDLLKYDFINFHPLQNDMTISITPEAFLHFFKILEKKPHIIKIPIQ